MKKRNNRTGRIIAVMLAVALSAVSMMGFAVSVSANEGVGGFVTRMYRIVLDRDPDEEGFDYWTSKLTSGEKSAADIVLGFFYSPEYLGMDKNNGEIVEDFYAAMLDREPDETGYNTWTQRLYVGMTMTAIASGFMNSPEFMALCDRYGINNGTVEITNPRDYNYERTYFAYRLYKNCLGREPEVAGLEDWCRKLAEGATGSEVANGFIFSGEYWENIPPMKSLSI